MNSCRCQLDPGHPCQCPDSDKNSLPEPPGHARDYRTIMLVAMGFDVYLQNGFWIVSGYGRKYTHCCRMVIARRIADDFTDGALRKNELAQIIDNREPVGMKKPEPGTYLFFIRELWEKATGKDKDFLATLYDHVNALYVEKRVYEGNKK